MRRKKLFALVLPAVIIVGVVYAGFSSIVVNPLLNILANQSYHWQCQLIKEKNLTQNGAVQWTQWSCTDKKPWTLFWMTKSEFFPLTVNIVNADLSDPHVQLVPALANTIDKDRPYIESLSQMGIEHANFIAGVNGGYFFVNSVGHHDQNCIWKHYPTHTTYDVGDGLLVINKKGYSENCGTSKTSTLARATIVQRKDGAWVIKEISANTTPSDIQNALGAGPLLISSDQTKQPKINLRWEGILSSFEFGANTAVILATDAKAHQHLLLFTVDGIDKRAGMRAVQMANFIHTMLPTLLHLKIVSAMNMDQGHSTAMYIRGEKNPIVSKADKSRTERPIYDALFVAEKY